MSDTHVKYEEMSQMSHIKLARRSETHCNRIKSLGHTLKVYVRDNSFGDFFGRKFEEFVLNIRVMTTSEEDPTILNDRICEI